MENLNISSGEISKDYDSRSKVFFGGPKCAICGEYSKHCDSSQKFHPFPKDPELSNKWTETLEKKWILEASPDTRNRKYRICSKHFLDSDYLNVAKIRLIKTTIPKSDTEAMDVSSLNVTKLKKLPETEFS